MEMRHDDIQLPMPRAMPWSACTQYQINATSECCSFYGNFNGMSLAKDELWLTTQFMRAYTLFVLLPLQTLTSEVLGHAGMACVPERTGKVDAGSTAASV